MLIDLSTGKPVVDPMNLVTGAKIRYTGDMANCSGKGAIINVEPCNYYGKSYTVALEDGRMWDCSPASFSGGTGCRLIVLNEPLATEEEIAALRTANVFLEAKARADKIAAESVFIAAIARIKAENPALEVGSGPVVAAKNIRKMLKAAFPSVKFSVKTSKYSGGSSIYVSYPEGINGDAVEGIAKRFEAGSFNGMDDCYEYSNSPWSETFGSASFVFVRKEA